MRADDDVIPLIGQPDADDALFTVFKTVFDRILEQFVDDQRAGRRSGSSWRR